MRPPTSSTAPDDVGHGHVRLEADGPGMGQRLVESRVQLGLGVEQPNAPQAGLVGGEPLLVAVDVLAPLGIPGDDQRQEAGSPALHDRRQAAVGDDGGRRLDPRRQLRGVDQGRTGGEVRRGRGAVLDEDRDLRMRCGPGVGPSHEPVERVVIGADHDDDRAHGYSPPITVPLP